MKALSLNRLKLAPSSSMPWSYAAVNQFTTKLSSSSSSLSSRCANLSTLSSSTTSSSSLHSNNSTTLSSTSKFPLLNSSSSLSNNFKLTRLQSTQSQASAPSPTTPDSKSTASSSQSNGKTTRWSRFWTNAWITEEAESIIFKSYACHRPLGDTGRDERPRPTKAELESLNTLNHFTPQTFGDRIALKLVDAVKPFVHLFFRDKYNHHALVLETVAAVPGMVGGMFRHLRSLRTMSRDFGWIHPLWEEAENERMHLLTWMQVTQPTPLEKMLVMLAQGFYFGAYSVFYLFSPGTAHRFVGYLEEEAVSAYSQYLNAIDKGVLPNSPAPEIAKRYWSLPNDATVRDVVLYIRADECMHRNANHRFAQLIREGRKLEPLKYPVLDSTFQYDVTKSQSEQPSQQSQSQSQSKS